MTFSFFFQFRKTWPDGFVKQEMKKGVVLGFLMISRGSLPSPTYLFILKLKILFGTCRRSSLSFYVHRYTINGTAHKSITIWRCNHASQYLNIQPFLHSDRKHIAVYTHQCLLDKYLLKVEVAKNICALLSKQMLFCGDHISELFPSTY